MSNTRAADGHAPEYEERRRHAFRLAVDGRREQALAELTEGWTDEKPDPGGYVADVARVQYLSGEYEKALAALEIVRGGVEAELTPLAVDCVRREPVLWRSALRIVTRSGPVTQRARAAWAVLRTR